MVTVVTFPTFSQVIQDIPLPSCQDAPVSPLGIVKFNTAQLGVPVFVTLALVQGCPVVVVPTATLPASQGSPLSPLGQLILLPSGFNITTQYLVGSSVLLTTLNLLLVSLSCTFVTLLVIPYLIID